MGRQPDAESYTIPPSHETSTTLTTSILSALSALPTAHTLSAGASSDSSGFSQGQQPPSLATLAMDDAWSRPSAQELPLYQNSSTVNGVVIGLLSSFGSAIFIALIFIIVYFFKYTAGGRIFLDRIGRPGEYDDEQAFLREEAEALEDMDDLQRGEYLRAKGGFGLVS
jgi:hypothetical protein